MSRYFYKDSIDQFLKKDSDLILGIISKNSGFADLYTQKSAWLSQISILKESLVSFAGLIYFEFSIPRMGKRIDVVLIIKNVIFVIEFKIGEKEFLTHYIDQVYDYALDLKNFHESSHKHLIAPILIASESKNSYSEIIATAHNDNVIFPVRTNQKMLSTIMHNVLEFSEGKNINHEEWEAGRYMPTPTIIEAAISLFNNHSVADISRSDASATNLSKTSSTIEDIISTCKKNNEKAICFVTGVPGAGKTLVGLNIATKNLNKETGDTSVFLSGNGPLVAILREALARDAVSRGNLSGKKVKKVDALREIKLFVQNIHHFRDHYLEEKRAPVDHVAIFDEAQRAWDVEQTSNFMKRKKNQPNFSVSEPEYLISCMDRHKDWAVIVCLVGGGQEINTGEAGISEWIDSINRSFSDWKLYVSNKLFDSEYAAGDILNRIENKKNAIFKEELHLSVSRRSFRAENQSLLIKQLLDLDINHAKKTYTDLKSSYPIALTRDVKTAKQWLKKMARGNERFGMVVSSQAERLKPFAIDVKSPMDPVNWFLNGKDDVRSSYYLEDVATEFQVQGLELDWSCVTWDGDFRYSKAGWDTFSFRGNKWQNINKPERKNYLKNAYRVLLTRARQGMVIVVPKGSNEDPTRKHEYYDETFNYLKSIGLELI